MLWLFLPFIIGLLAGVPISIALALGAIVFLLFSPFPLQVLTLQMYQSTTSFPLMAIPFFVLAGDLMSRTGVTFRLMRFAKIIVGRIKGGLSQVMIVTATVFAGLSGSAVADTAAMAKVLGPDMEKEGYDKDYVASLAASCGVLGPVIPPSTMMIIYGATINVSIGAMFVGGIIPGLIIAAFLMITTYIIATIKNHPKGDSEFSLRILFQGLKDGALALIMPLIIIIGIRGGVFTPTEGGAIAVFYSLLLGALVYRSLTMKDLVESLITSGITAAIIMLIVAASNPFGWILSIEKIPQAMAQFVTGITTNKLLILAIINVFLLAVGMFMETAAIIVLLGPILAPIAYSVGVDPVHFGVLMVINLTIGMATPPVGVCLFVAAPIMKTTIERITKSILPLLGALLLALLLITYVPQLVLWLPSIIR
ncbi:TRAP transporter large permease [Desulfitibacter alkalitolerans]|uniref:TRAP transporter large permease n=1 Tax=Desulfitibacter alkalitolerans TaxID=264641 RepID=UPI00048738B4|nr:TRAP transporter large permease [Desulfitibacter alkalitolerans]